MGLLLLASCGGSDQAPLELRSTRLRAVLADNQGYPGHLPGYNGVAELYLDASTRSAFAPGAAGLNLEHIFSGDAASYGWDVFEPQLAPMQLVRQGRRGAELRQEGTANWPLKTTVRFELAGDTALDFTVRCVPVGDVWRKHGYIGLFFASYSNSRHQKAIYFIGRRRGAAGDRRPQWVRHVSPRHGVRACHRPAASSWNPALDRGFNLKLVAGFSYWEYLYPFYYGVANGNMLLFMFDPPAPDGEVRFAQSPYGGPGGNPAWDFFYLKRGYRVGEEFSFRGRLVYQEFRGPEQAVRLYEAWSGESVEVPADAAAPGR